MSTRSYWLDLFTGTSWQEFLEAGSAVSGFREGRWRMVQQIKLGDYLLCYMTGISRWIGVLEVVSAPYQDTEPIWKDALFPCRLHVKPVVTLTPETAVPIVSMRDQLSIFNGDGGPYAWTGHLRGSPARWSTTDGEAVVQAVLEASRNPTVRPVDAAKLARRPPTLKTRSGAVVTIPEPEPEPAAAPVPLAAPKPRQKAPEQADEASLHTEVQWLLLKLGSDMGLDVWVARNDRGRLYQGRPLSDVPRMKETLPLQFDEATTRTIELIDVLWLRGNAIVSAFEIECTTSIYSGLLRMSDLVAMQPNLKIPLYLVAPDERRNKVVTEINRPTFARLSPPMSQVCSFIPISALRERLRGIASVVQYLRPEFIEDIAEVCVVGEA